VSACLWDATRSESAATTPRAARNPFTTEDGAAPDDAVSGTASMDE
jgi:hypothetical protein